MILAALALACVTGAVYRPALDASFLNWDDNICVSDNAYLRGPAWQTVRWALTTDRAGYPMPLTWLSHALDYRLYGLDPRGHHRTSVLLHVANTVLVLVALHALTGALWQSIVVAALFGLHPLHVEAVAWVAERKEVLSAFFSLLALLAYARYARVRTRASLLVVAIAFVAALLSKPMAMTLPAVLLLLDYWPLRRRGWSTKEESETGSRPSKMSMRAEAQMNAMTAETGGFVFERGVHVYACRQKRGRKAEQHAGQRGHRDRKTEHAGVRAEIELDRDFSL